MLKTEWKVSDTGSAHWASSYNSNSLSSLLISFAKCIPHFFSFFYKNCLFNIVSFYHPFWIIWLFLLHISKRFFPFIEENGTLWLTKNRSTNGFYCLGVMALEIQEYNSQHFYGIYIYVTCRTSPEIHLLQLKCILNVKSNVLTYNLIVRQKTFITEVDIWDNISLVIGMQIRINYEWFLL